MARRVITPHRDFFWPTSDDWYQNHARNTVQVRVSSQSTDGQGFVRLSVWGADDFGMERDLHGATAAELQQHLATQLHTADHLPNPLTQEWLTQQGFVRA